MTYEPTQGVCKCGCHTWGINDKGETIEVCRCGGCEHLRPPAREPIDPLDEAFDGSNADQLPFGGDSA
jgi:hypothetical protein